MDQSAAEHVGNEYTEEEIKCRSHDSCKEINSDSEDSSIKSAAWSSAGNNQIIKRKLHKSYVVTWSTQISQNGFAKCLIETCNFISLDLQIMQEHYRTCDGIQKLETNLCPFCKNRLPSEDELSNHKSKCKGKVHSDIISNADNSTEKNPRVKRGEVHVQVSECSEKWIKSSAMDKANTSFDEVVYCEQCNQGFLTEEEFSHHSQSCKQLPKPVVPRKRDRSMCTSVILKNRINKEFDENCIIQPGRDIPQGQYVRRRGYTKQHKSIWEAAIEKCKYVKCIFQNCHFLGLSVEDMISHFGYCNGDGSFARYVCPYCEGRVTSEKYLEIHIRRSHSDMINSHFMDMGTESPREMVNCAVTYMDENEVQVKNEELRVKMEGLNRDYEGRRVANELLCSENDSLVDGELSERELQQNCASSYQFSDANCIQKSPSILPGNQISELSETQKVQHLKTNCCYKDDHIYFKKKGRIIAEDQEADPSLLVMKKSNLKHYSGPKNTIDRPSEKDQMSAQEEESEGNEVPLKKSFQGDDSGKYVRQMIKFSFPAAEENVKRKVHQYYTTSWTESIKKNGFARCLVATCNFISLDIFHIQNHFKTCNGVPANGPNLCTFCGSRLPSATELSVHSSKCKAYSEDNLTCDIPCPYEDNLTEQHNDEDVSRGISYESGSVDRSNLLYFQETSSETLSANEMEPNQDSFELSSDMHSKKGKGNSLRISDIMKLKDNGNTDCSRIIQPGPDLSEGQYLRRRAYTKRHRTIWESALNKHKYVKCIFQNCHFLAMSLEDMIYHFGYCIGDGSFAKFECPHCKGRVTSQSVLDIHIQVSHSEKLIAGNVNHFETNEDYNVDLEYPSLAELKKIVTRKEIKTYGRNSARRSRSSKSVDCDMVVKVEPFGPIESLETSLNENCVTLNDSGLQSPKNDMGDNNMVLRGCNWTYTGDESAVSSETDFSVGGNFGAKEMEISESANSDEHENKNCIDGRGGHPESAGNASKRTREGISRNRKKSKAVDLCEERNVEHDVETCNRSAIAEASTEKEEDHSKRMKTEVSEVKIQPRKRGRPPKAKNNSEVSEVTQNSTDSRVSQTKGKRGRKRTVVDDESSCVRSGSEEVTCAKCKLKIMRSQFKDHNMRRHVGLGWIEGENPVDPNDEETVSRNVKQAFKFVKSGTCEGCGVVKKSALGFISHIENCGKTEEEKEALKVTCPYCPSRILKYSLPMHLKLSHSEPVQDVARSKNDAEDESLPSKRQSAIKAVNKFHEVLKHCNDEEETKVKAHYVLYEKGVSKLPKLPIKVRGLWRKMMKENKKIPCRRGSCLAESSGLVEAKHHHFQCSELPEKSYICQYCDYYSIAEVDIQQHVSIHAKNDEDFTVGSEEERLELETEAKDCIEVGEPGYYMNRSRNTDASEENSLEATYKVRFFARERLLNERKSRFCSRSLRMTLESEIEEMKDVNFYFSGLGTKITDWTPESLGSAIYHLPSQEESISFHVHNKMKELTWNKVKRFEGLLVEGTPVIFTGGSILSLSWCKNSLVRLSGSNTKEYLAVSSGRRMDKLQDIHEIPYDYSGLIQIWDCGELNNVKQVIEVPRMVIGILHDSGEVWDLSWFPSDVYEEITDEKRMTTLGLLGAACQDGTVRIWSILDPEQLSSRYGQQFYRVEPRVILELEERGNSGCLRLSFGRTGIIVGGFANGIVAVWNLKSITSSFCKKVGQTFVLKPYLSFQAHRTSITALSICPNNDRYISTSGLDRYLKSWDLECVTNPMESMQKEVCLANIWPKHWPFTISTFEDVVPSGGNGMIKGIRDAYCDKHRAPLAMDSTCWCLSFNEWLNALTGCSSKGEVKVRYLRNMFIADEKFRLRTGNILSKTELKPLNEIGRDEKCDSSCEDLKSPKESFPSPKTYEEACQYFGIIITDYIVDGDDKQKNVTTNKKKDINVLDEYPITSITKVCWNPNYKSFSYLAIGHHCGLIRIKRLSDVKCNDELSSFYREAKESISQVIRDVNIMR